MLNYISKSKTALALMLILTLLLIFIPIDSYETNSIVISTHTSQSKMMFSPSDFTATFFFSEKINQLKESHFAETKNRRQLVNYENYLEALQASLYKGTFINYGITVFSFYVIICVLIVQTVIKYIYKKDGKKEPHSLI